MKDILTQDRTTAQLKHFAHVQRRDSKYTEQKMLNMELAGTRKRGRL